MKLKRAFIAASHDLIMAALSFIIALYLRLGDQFYTVEHLLLPGTLLFTVICAGVFTSFHLYKGMWRYASLQDLMAITKAVSLALLIFLPSMFLYNRLEAMPRSVFLINWLVLLVMLGAPRFCYRLLRDQGFTLQHVTGQSADHHIKLLLVGIDDTSEHFLRESLRKDSEYNVVGIIDNDPNNINRNIHNIPVYGDMYAIAKIVKKLRSKGTDVQKILISPNNIHRQTVQTILEMAEQLGLTLARLPKVTELKPSQIGDKLEIRPIAIEDLLGRAQASLDRRAMANLIHGNRILITGCGGTIGSELARQIANYNPTHITLLDLSEFNLYSIENELIAKYPKLSRKTILGDVRNRQHMELLFQKERPDLVFHAAALKHVPLLESPENALEAIHTNVYGTKNIADCALKYNAKGMVLISTDKAVNPTNIMGATKRLGERYVQTLGTSSDNQHTKFSIVRFGNVLGSSGSVIPLFQKQLAQGGPLTVTDPNITRYFMTVREAVELVLEASVAGMKQKEDNSSVFVLDMGEPIKIADLAAQMIRMAGFKPDIDIEITYTGLRPGEKLSEELTYNKEKLQATQYPGIQRVSAPNDNNLAAMNVKLTQLHVTLIAGNFKQTFTLLSSLVPEYHSLTKQPVKQPAYVSG